MVRPLFFYPKRTNQAKRIDAGDGLKKESVIPKQDAFYYYVKDGDFSIAWFNVFVFVVTHLLLAHTYYVTITDHSDKAHYTFIYCA